MHTTNWTSYEARDEIGVGALDIERLISIIDSASVDDFDLGEPWNGELNTLDDDPE
jgi:hypothetical protein